MEHLHHNREQFAETIHMAAYKTGIAPAAIEKDYYVTVILKLLSEKLPYIVFKGGTSLSKCFHAIKRFSEDIDITVNTSITQGEKRKVKKTIVSIVSELGLTIANIDDTRSRRDYNQYIIEYPSVLEDTPFPVNPAVLVETSYAEIAFPTIPSMVDNYIGQMLIVEAPELLSKYALKPFTMNVQSLDRTFVDKIFAICDYYLQGNARKHSRHLYDIYMLSQSVSIDASLKKLFEEVREVRKKNDICPSAQDGVDIPQLLHKIVKEEIYKSDYENLTRHLLEEPIDYGVVIEAIITIAESELFLKD